MYTFDSRVRYSEIDDTRKTDAAGADQLFSGLQYVQSEDIGVGT